MAEPVHIPTAKITPPGIGVPLLPRGRLHAAVRDGIRRKLLVLSAEAGYGKTSLLLSALPELDLPVAWLTLDESDADPNLFSAGLVAAIRTVVPGFGQDVLKILTTGPSPSLLRRSLVEGLDDLSAAVIVLDDFHTVDHGEEVTSLLDDLLAQLPPAVHLIIATRTWPALVSLPRLLVQGEAATLDRTVLAMTGAEVAAFLHHSHGVVVDEAQADHLARHTEGWAAAVQLVALASRTRGTLPLSGTPREIYDYLATTVLDAQEEPVREFLLRTSILAELWPSACSALIPEVDPGAMLEDLSRRNLFLYRLDETGGRFRYHQLFAEFLQQRLAARGSQVASTLQRTAAQRLEAEGVPDQAVRHYMAAGAYEDAERIMRPLHGDRLTARLAYTFRDLINRLPETVLDRHPWMTRCGASASRFVGDYMGGLRLSRRALAAAEGRDPNLWAFSMHGAAVMLVHMDRYEEAVGTSLEALNALHLGVEPRWRNALLVVLADAWLNLGRVQEAAAVLPRIQLIPTSAAHPGRGLTDEYLEAMVASVRMEYARAAAHLQTALAAAQERGSLTNQTLVLTEICALELARRNLPPALEALRRAQALHRQTGERATELEQTHLAAAAAMLSGDLVGAEQLYQGAVEQCREGEMQEPKIRALAGLASIAMRRGNLSEADALLLAAIRLGEQIKLGKVLPLLRLQQVSLLRERGNASAARSILPGLRESFAAWQSQPGLARVHLWEAQLQWDVSPQRGLAPDAHAALHAGLQVAASVDDDILPFLTDEAAWTGPLLLAALKHGIQVDAASSLLARMGPPIVDAVIAGLADESIRMQAISLLGRIGDPRARRPLMRVGQRDRARKASVDAALAKLRAPAPVTLHIQMLGALHVTRDGAHIADAEWRTQKVRTLLKYLLLHRRRPVPQDELIEVLWPQGDPASGAVNLKTAVKTLRQVLEPMLEGSKSSFIVRDQSGLRFADAGRCWIDLDEYDREISAGRRYEAEGHPLDAAAALERAVGLYGGDLLDDDRYADWAALERERRREMHIEVLESLAALREADRDYRRAIAAVQQVLALDRLRESAYRQLMRYALARGDRQAARSAYQRCERLLREELGVAPQPETTALFEQARTTASV